MNEQSILDNEMRKKLIFTALDMTKRSYAPYSNFKVGAALLTGNGRIYTGCNIENAAFTPTNCAERTAFFKAVSEGERVFTAIAVAGGMHGEIRDLTAPCGVCLQVMMEFCDPESFIILMAADGEHYEEKRLKELLPKGFGAADLERKEKEEDL